MQYLVHTSDLHLEQSDFPSGKPFEWLIKKKALKTYFIFQLFSVLRNIFTVLCL